MLPEKIVTTGGDFSSISQNRSTMPGLPHTNYSTRVIRGNYFPHLDGIRALAVLPVVLFHILPGLSPGGFVGVDVFFVISGYLITGGILRDLANDRFSLRDFYHRRMRRILPAYFVLVAGVFAAGIILYYATPLKFLGDSVAASALFLANFYFWMLGGDYFTPALHSQALLNLWSLSVEEQFYLFIPLLCAGVWKFSRRGLAPVLLLLALLSLVSAIHAVLIGKQSNAFFMLQFRAWELLAGALLAWIPLLACRPWNPCPRSLEAAVTASVTLDKAAPGRSPKTVPALLATVGLLLVLLPCVAYSTQTPFPGAAALPPVVGALLLIHYGPTGWVSALLTWPPLVQIGRISYSLYLWHWPVIVFWRYATFDQLLGYDYVGMFLLSLLLAFLSWRFVELPFRSSDFWTRRRTFAFASAGITLLVALGTVCVAAQGWPASFHPAANAISCNDPRRPFVAAASRLVLRHAGVSLGDAWDSLDIAERSQALALVAAKAAPTSVAPNSPAVFVMGDSHASVFLDGFKVVLDQHGLAAQCAGHTATIMFNLESQVCQDALRKLQQFPAINKILLLQDWTYHLHQSPTPEVLYQQLEQFAIHARSLHKTLYIATDNPIRDFSPVDLAARMLIITPRHPEATWAGRQSFSDYNRMQGTINLRLAELCRNTGAILLPLHQALVKDGFFPAFADQHGRLIPLYQDESHLSFYGSQVAAEFVFSRLFPTNDLTPLPSAALPLATP